MKEPSEKHRVILEEIVAGALGRRAGETIETAAVRAMRQAQLFRERRNGSARWMLASIIAAPKECAPKSRGKRLAIAARIAERAGLV